MTLTTTHLMRSFFAIPVLNALQRFRGGETRRGRWVWWMWAERKKAARDWGSRTDVARDRGVGISRDKSRLDYPTTLPLLSKLRLPAE